MLITKVIKNTIEMKKFALMVRILLKVSTQLAIVLLGILLIHSYINYQLKSIPSYFGISVLCRVGT